MHSKAVLIAIGAPVIFMIFIFQWLQLNRVNLTKFSAINYSTLNQLCARANMFFQNYLKGNPSLADVERGEGKRSQQVQATKAVGTSY